MQHGAARHECIHKGPSSSDAPQPLAHPVVLKDLRDARGQDDDVVHVVYDLDQAWRHVPCRTRHIPQLQRWVYDHSNTKIDTQEY
jgi:hypothetical protein